MQTGVGCVVGIDVGSSWPTLRRVCVDTGWQQLELISFALASCDICGLWMFVVPKPHATVENKQKPWPRMQSLHRVGSRRLA